MGIPEPSQPTEQRRSYADISGTIYLIGASTRLKERSKIYISKFFEHLSSIFISLARTDNSYFKTQAQHVEWGF